MYLSYAPSQNAAKTPFRIGPVRRRCRSRGLRGGRHCAGGGGWATHLAFPSFESMVEGRHLETKGREGPPQKHVQKEIRRNYFRVAIKN